MHGSFTPDSAEKFLELMREAGYETSALPTSDGLQTFSELGINPGATQGDVWSGNVADFGEVRGEYIENYDYTRCVRPNGTAYGTGGTCRKGTPAEKEEHDALSQLQQMLPKGEKIVTSSGSVFGKEPKASSNSSGEIATAPVPPKPIKDPVPGILRSQAEVKGIIADRPETPNAIRDEMGRPLKLSSDRLKALSQEDLETEWNRAKTTSRQDSLREEIDRRESEGKLGGKVTGAAATPPKPLKRQHLANMMMEHANIRNRVAAEHGGEIRSKAAKEQFAAALKKAKVPDKEIIKAALVKQRAESQGLDFSKEETYEFTRCVRPDGSAYGTGGRCKKGTQTDKVAAVKKNEPAEPEVGKSSASSRSGVKVKVFKPDPGVSGERARKKLANLLSEYMKSEQDHYAKFAKDHKLSDVELGSILHYSANGYIAMNILMRGRKPPEGAYKGAGGAKSGPLIANEAIVGLQSAMKKLPKYEGDVQRGIRVSREEVDKFFKVGGIYSDPAVQSSSAGKARSNESYGTVFGNRAIDYDKATAKGSARNTALNTVGVTLRISGDHGGRYLGKGSAAKGEEEVLIPPGQPFKVRKVSKMPMHIIVELEAISS